MGIQIQKLANLTLNAFKATRKIPVKNIAVGTALFGTGVLTGGMMYDTFKREQKAEPVKEEVQVQKKTQAAKSEEPKFKYVSPVIGENGIVKADTTYYAGTKTPEVIKYVDKDGKSKVKEFYDESGKLSCYSYMDGEGTYKTYDNKGKLAKEGFNTGDGNTVVREYNYECDRWDEDVYDKQGRLISEKNFSKDSNGEIKVSNESFEYNDDGSMKNTYSYNYGQVKWVDSYLSDGSTIHTDYKYGDKTNETVEDKNGKKLKERHYKDGVLDYTVVPKYNKDGDIVKNDTIRNS